MHDNAQGGNDTLTAIGNGPFILFGESVNMDGSSHLGNDLLIGGDGNDHLFGESQHYGIPGHPAAFPGSITGGTDTLIGGAGDDQLWGGPNDDKFVFGVGSGNDTINDFNRGNLAVGSTATEHDVIDVQAYGFGSWTNLQAAITYVSGNAVIDLPGTGAITLLNIPIDSLQQSDFII
jgi:Ca2+-binding RTX toxin-like protein